MADFVIWQEEYSVTNRSIDIQHKYLIGILNKVFALVKDKSPSEDISRILEELKAYTETHFKYEEKLMQIAGYPDIKSHRSLHRTMADRTEGMCKMQKASSAGIMPAHVLDFLKEWWINHIRAVDKQYAPYLSKLNLKE